MLRGNWQDFNWHDASRGPSAIAKLLVTIRYDTIRDAILTCARKPTWVSLIYHTEPTIKKCKNRKKTKSRKQICPEITVNSPGNGCLLSDGAFVQSLHVHEVESVKSEFSNRKARLRLCLCFMCNVRRPNSRDPDNDILLLSAHQTTKRSRKVT